MRTCLVGQSKLFRAGLALILRNTEFAVQIETEAIRNILETDLEQVLILIHKPDDVLDIADGIEELKARANPPWIVLLAKTIERDQLASSFACGVDGYLLEEISPEALLDCLHLVTLGEKVFPSQLAVLMCGIHWEPTKRNIADVRGVQLSEREVHIVHWLAEGCPNKVIATKLAITEATVKVHVKTILKKLGAQNRTQAAIWAVQQGLSFAPELLAQRSVLAEQPPTNGEIRTLM